MMKITRERKKYRIDTPYDEKLKFEINKKKAEEIEKKKEERIEEKKEEKETRHEKSSNKNKSDNVAKQFMTIYKRYLKQTEDAKKCQAKNELINETKSQTKRRKKVKKLNFKIKKNNLIEKLIKNKARIEINNNVSNIFHKIKNKSEHSTSVKCIDGALQEVNQLLDNNSNLHKISNNDTPQKIINSSTADEGSKHGNVNNSKDINQDNINNKNKNRSKNNNKNNNNPIINSNKKNKKRSNILNQYDEIMASKKFLNNPLEFANNVLKTK
ncbi:conserved protein, unknown function [Hepatocystis sp. ex Piliocolobus tephrosceles]|nr:conserved protein, unknown function [Hepatocystis sp. ex Piliocolobus tephrosceles]